jgi:NADPH2:quinone reductase
VEFDSAWSSLLQTSERENRSQETTMHAWLCEQPTGVDALQWKELPTPEPGPKQVRVAIHAASLNFPDILIVQNKYHFKPEPPFVPGSEYAGVIEAVGAEVKGLKAGMSVAVIGGTGGFGTHAVADANRVQPLPPGFPFEDGAAFAFTYGTSHHALIDRAALKAGETVFVLGAAGGVGTAALQIAKAAGARVIGTASPNNHEFLRSLGADQVIDYRSQKFEDVVKNVDLVLNTADAATTARSIAVVRSGGTLVSIVGPPDAAACAAAKIRCARPDRETGASNADMLARVVELADAGKFKVFVDGTFSLADASKAWDKSREGHTRGKLIIQVSEGPTMKHQ